MLSMIYANFRRLGALFSVVSLCNCAGSVMQVGANGIARGHIVAGDKFGISIGAPTLQVTEFLQKEGFEVTAVNTRCMEEPTLAVTIRCPPDELFVALWKPYGRSGNFNLYLGTKNEKIVRIVWLRDYFSWDS